MRFLLCIVSLFGYAATSNATSAVSLGTAATFGVLSGSAGITNTGPTSIGGNLGTIGVSVIGFPPGTLTGTIHIDDSVAIAAQTDAIDAYASAVAEPPGVDMSTMSDLTGMTLGPGTYTFAEGASLTGELFLAGNASTNDVFLFQIGTTLLINGGSSVILESGAVACKVIWQVGTSATLAVGVEFEGIILAHVGISANSGASIVGGLYSDTASITLADNAITLPVC